jgi:hypothetical protein
MDQLDSIGLDGNQVSNWLTLANSLKAQDSNAQERDVEPSSEDKVVVHELQIEDTQEDNNVITSLSSQNKSRLISLSKENQLKILHWSMSIKMGRRRMPLMLMEVKSMTNKEVEGRSLASRTSS